MSVLLQLDLVFCVDLTGSMSGFISVAKRQMAQVLDAFAPQLHGGLRVGIVGFRDHCDGDKLLATNKAKANPYFQDAVDEWQKSKDSFGTLAVPDDQKERFLAFAKIGAAESLFYLADRDFDKFKAIGFPVFKVKVSGKGEDKKKEMQEKFNGWMQGDFVKWMGDKAKALETAQKSYEGIAELKVPQWDIAAATRVGDMYLSFVNDFRDAPVPPALEGDEELVSIYYQGLDEASKPWVDKAKNAYEFCLITATKVRWFNKFMTR